MGSSDKNIKWLVALLTLSVSSYFFLLSISHAPPWQDTSIVHKVVEPATSYSLIHGSAKAPKVVVNTEKQQIVEEQQQQLSKSKIYPPRIIHENSCAFGLLLWKSPKGFLNIWSPSLRQASNSSFERSSEYYCACPRGYDQHGCAKSNQELKIPQFRMARCTYGWHNVEFNKLRNETNVKHLNKMEKLFSRYLHNRYHGGVLVPLLEINQTITKVDELTTENPVDQYFLDLALNNTGWNDLDLSTIHLLLTYNQKLFYDSTEPLLTGDMTRSDWFNGKSIILGKVLYTFMFSKCGALDVIEYMLNIMYSKDHYFVLFLSENMNNCRKQVEDMVERIRLDNSEATNIWIVPQHLSFKSYRAHITLVYMNIIPVLYSFLNGMTDWSHEVNLSEAHFPLTSTNQFSQFLRNRSSIFQTFVSTEYPKPNERYKYVTYSCTSLDVLSEMFGSRDIIAIGGSQWKIWSNVQWRLMLSSVTALNTLFKFKYSIIPDELYFTSITHTFTTLHSGNSSAPVLMVDGTRTILPNLVNVKDNLTYLKWVHGRGSPMPITDQYREEVIKFAQSGTKFFARKMMNVLMAKNITRTLGFSKD